MLRRTGIAIRLAATILLGLGCIDSAKSMELTIDRLFDAPALAGPTLLGLKVAPDGSRVTFLKGKAGAKDQLDLWEYNIADRRVRLLVDSDKIGAQSNALSTEEKNRRERQRTAALSGILDYSFAPSGRSLVLGAGGILYQYALDVPGDRAVRTLTAAGNSATDPQVSPQGGYVGYIKNQNLFVYDLANAVERALSHDGGGTIKNGMAEFVAQEEMDRSTGYWWSPDDQRIAFARIDESPVQLKQRFEISADTIDTVTQRYPAAGEANAQVQLGVVDVHSGAVKWIELGSNRDIYLARVNWLPDGKRLAIQIESRDQRRLDLVFADAETGTSTRLLTETSHSWIEIGDELTFLKKSPEFIWASSRDGYRHLSYTATPVD